MFPSFELFGRTIGMYGLMIVVGIITGISITVIRAKKFGLLREDTLFACLFAGIGIYIGAKVLYLITVIPEIISYRQHFFEQPSLLLSLLIGGFVFYGGLIGALLGIFIYCRLYHISVLAMFDLISPAIPIVHSFGRLGCLFAGCCYGIPYEGPGNIIFHKALSAPNEISLFPTQPLESGLNLIIGVFLIRLAKPGKKPGKIIGSYLAYYSLLRFLLEFFRGDIVRGSLFGFSTSQWISLAMLPFGLLLIFYPKKSR